MNFAYGDSRALQFIINNDFKIYNFSSLKEVGIPLYVIPPNNLCAINEYDFDCKYAQYIMMNDQIFYNMMCMLMDLYNGQDVFMLIADEYDSFFDNNVSSWNIILVESFLKFIQQRYGINATLIESEEDLNTMEFTEFSDFGIMNFDEDKERWSYITELNRINSGGIPYGSEKYQ